MISLTWAECGCILKQLQTAAFAVYAEVSQTFQSDTKSALHGLLLKILACLQEFRQTISIQFLLNDHKITSQLEHCSIKGFFTERQIDQIKKLLAVTQASTQTTIPTIKCVQQICFKYNQNELATVAHVNDILTCHDLPQLDAVNKQRLRVLVTKLRQREQQLSFHRELLKAQQEFLRSESNYSAENFAYGSTPFTTWLTLFTQKAVTEKLAYGSRQATLMVFGASSGSLVFFAALVLGLRSVGVEILRFLYDVAEQLRTELQISQDSCCFKCADMVTVSMHNVSRHNAGMQHYIRWSSTNSSLNCNQERWSLIIRMRCRPRLISV